MIQLVLLSLLGFSLLLNKDSGTNKNLNIIVHKPLRIQGFIAGGQLDIPHTNVVKTARSIQKRVRNGHRRISIIINSGGGYVDVGYYLIKTMRHAQDKGVKFSCVVDGAAYSMALAILTACDRRYGTFGSSIMWHSAGRMFDGKLDVFNTEEMNKEFKRINKELWADTREYFDDEYFEEHFKEETLIDVSEIEDRSDYLRVVNKIRYK